MAAAHKNPGNFANNREKARMAGRKGGAVSPGNFKNDPARASKAGRKGGSK
jgi:general stress protein YciG